MTVVRAPRGAGATPPTTRSCGSSTAADDARRHLRRGARRPRARAGRDGRGRGHVPAAARIVAVSDEGLRAARREDARRGRRGRRHPRLRALLPPARGGRDRADARGLDRAGHRPARRSTSSRHDADAEREALQKAIVLRLNGGLGTSMGLTGAKSLLEAKDGLSFLDIIARQVLALREAHDARLPLVLMDSFSTREDSLEALAAHPDLDVGLPLDFIQNKEPKLLRRRPDAGRVAGRPGARVVPARPRRPLHRARDLGDARGPARARLRVRVRGQLRQPRRGARAAHPRLAARGARSRS